MKKKLILSLFMALVMVFAISGAVFADDVSVVVSDIAIDGTGLVGTDVTASGTVTITATASSNYGSGWFNPYDFANADSSWGYTIDGDGVALVDGGSDSDSHSGWNGANANASFTYTWSDTFKVQSQSDYAVTAFGSAEAESFATWFWMTFGYEYHDTGVISKTATVTGIKGIASRDWYNDGRFEVAIGDLTYHGAYAMQNGVLLEDVSLFGYCNGKGLHVVISKGTAVSGTDKLLLSYNPLGNYPVNGTLEALLPQNAQFSNAVGVFETLGGGDESLFVSFKEIKDGTIQPLIIESPEADVEGLLETPLLP